MPRLSQEFLDALRRWAAVEERKVQIRINFEGPGILRSKPLHEIQIWCFDHASLYGFFAESKSDLLTGQQLQEKAREEALARLKRLEERRVA